MVLPLSVYEALTELCGEFSRRLKEEIPRSKAKSALTTHLLFIFTRFFSPLEMIIGYNNGSQSATNNSSPSITSHEYLFKLQKEGPSTTQNNGILQMGELCIH